jgi:hypothetical protein
MNNLASFFLININQVHDRSRDYLAALVFHEFEVS